MPVDYHAFFRNAMGHEISPYPYQIRLAEEPWPDLVKVETGMGKTAGIILAWLFKRLQRDPDTPRRLVYCLPMRVLVEQTVKNANLWIQNLANSNLIQSDACPSVHVLMGGEIENDWDRYPEKDAILVGTQDQLLSRALNRGYAMSRFRWPMHFGLLNNDCLWVMDEVQLMGSGLATTTQLDAFRHKLGTIFPVQSVWMSATLEKGWLRTVDFETRVEKLNETGLSADDKSNSSVKRLLGAKKRLQRADCPADDTKKIAELILEVHRRRTRTLVVVNTVKRAMEIYNAVRNQEPDPSITLVHSRFRQEDRGKALERALAPPGKNGSICISTQVVEAGVDVSATTLVADLAPWASMVQRFGRCNRYGEDKNARVIWLALNLEKKGAALPYKEEDLKQAADILTGLKDVGLNRLPSVASGVDHIHVLRRKDILDLFDTTPDLAGADIDISRFIRETDDYDVQVFWRDLAGQSPADDEPAPSRNELCSVPVRDLRGMTALEKWRWDHLERRRVRPETISPGMVFMLRTSSGGYSSELGWTGKATDIPEAIETGKMVVEADGDDIYASVGWQSLLEHTQAVTRELNGLLSCFQLPSKDWEQALLDAALWHDAGKAHNVFQKAMLGDPAEADGTVVWAKTGRRGASYERRGFRHELASALGAVINGMPDLVAYLVAAHHGKVRLSIRSLPHETRPDDPTLRFARGIWDEDVIGEVELGNDQKLPETVMDLSYMELGEGPHGSSWLARMLSLRDNPDLGPFRLAFFEGLIRAADWRASMKVDNGDTVS